ncbi:carbonic anhydrase [Actinoalloteichus hymeniacidonis]|nr:carbonic anhydrase [Actinoalloteichus hymeniacidonis]
MSRRRLFGLGAAATAGLALASFAAASPVSGQTSPPGTTSPAGHPADATEAWRLLTEGNARFVQGQPSHPHQDESWRDSLVEGQNPFATVLGCADSRVPPEVLFDQGFGDLFTIRSAGEVLDDAVVGSIEYGVEHVGTPLVVILGHAQCGAVAAAIDTVNGEGHLEGDISSLVRDVEAAVRATPADSDPDAFFAACVENQVRRTAAMLLERSDIVRDAVEGHGVQIVTAVYDLETGQVNRID